MENYPLKNVLELIVPTKDPEEIQLRFAPGRDGWLKQGSTVHSGAALAAAHAISGLPEVSARRAGTVGAGADAVGSGCLCLRWAVTKQNNTETLIRKQPEAAPRVLSGAGSR